MWFRVADEFASHPKVIECSDSAVALWVRAGSYATQHLTDGRITPRQVSWLGGTAETAAELVDAGLWEVEGNGWVFHDWFDYQPSKSATEHERKRMKEGAAKGNHQRWHVAKGIRDDACELCNESSSIAHPIAYPIGGGKGEANRGAIPSSTSTSTTDFTDSPTARRHVSPARDDRQPDAAALAHAIQEHTGLTVTPERAAKIGADIVAKAPGTVRSPQGYALAAVRKNPQEVRQLLREDTEQQWEQAMAETPRDKPLAQLDGHEMSLVQDYVRGFRDVLPSHLRAAAEEARRERETA